MMTLIRPQDAELIFIFCGLFWVGLFMLGFGAYALGRYMAEKLRMPRQHVPKEGHYTRDWESLEQKDTTNT